MTEIAEAAGFGSIRRFNETFQHLYQRSPGALRRMGVTDESAATAGAITVRLGYKPPFDWDEILSFLRAGAIPGVEAVSRSRYARTIALDGDQGILFVEIAAKDCLKVTVKFPKLRRLPAIIARVRRVFDLTADPVAIGAHLSQDPLLAPLFASRLGLRPQVHGMASNLPRAPFSKSKLRCRRRSNSAVIWFRVPATKSPTSPSAISVSAMCFRLPDNWLRLTYP